MRTLHAAEQLDNVTETLVLARLLKIGINRIRDLDELVTFGASGEHPQPVDHELPVSRGVWQLKRIEHGRNARTQHVVAAADCTNEQLRASVFVEKNEDRKSVV